ncbi:MAG: hypothetical protein Q8P16_01220, partial [bacterium]|nr:hypothetical protein [bacterium]
MKYAFAIVAVLIILFGAWLMFGNAPADTGEITPPAFNDDVAQNDNDGDNPAGLPAAPDSSAQA